MAIRARAVTTKRRRFMNDWFEVNQPTAASFEARPLCNVGKLRPESQLKVLRAPNFLQRERESRRYRFARVDQLELVRVVVRFQQQRHADGVDGTSLKDKRRAE